MIKNRTYEMTPLLKRTIKEAIEKSTKKGQAININAATDKAIDIIYGRGQGQREPRILKANNLQTVSDIKSAICAYILWTNVDNF